MNGRRQAALGAYMLWLPVGAHGNYGMSDVTNIVGISKIGNTVARADSRTG